MIKIFLKNKAVVISASIISAIVLLAVFVPVFSSFDPERQDLALRLTSPGSGHILGTDELGKGERVRVFSA